MSVITFGPPKQLIDSTHSMRNVRPRRGAAPEEPDKEQKEQLLAAIRRVEVVSRAFADAHTPPGSLEVRFWPTVDEEVEDRVPEPSPADQLLYRNWVTDMARRLHDRVEVRNVPVQRVNCRMGQARSPTVVLAWLRLYHGLQPQHLRWALAALQANNKAAGHVQPMDGSLDRFQGLLESL